MKRCKLCEEDKEDKEFKKNSLFIMQEICSRCLEKAKKRLIALADFDLRLCKELGLDYYKMTMLRKINDTKERS